MTSKRIYIINDYSEYRRPEPFINKRVVVVGRGNSAVQIAVELADVCHMSNGVIWSTGIKEPVDRVIFATEYWPKFP